MFKKFILGLALCVASVCAWAGPQVAIRTNVGDIVVELDNKKAPETVANFLRYVNDGFYNGTIFHRVIDGFMIQGGGFTPNMLEKTTRPPIRNEAYNGLKNDTYTIAMARTMDVNSATSQFFINVANNDALNYKSSTVAGFGYAVFGKVISGQNIVDQIRKVRTTTKGNYSDVPVTPIIIVKAEVIK